MWCLGLCAQTATSSGAFFGQTLLSCLHPTLGSLMSQLTLQFYWERQTNQPFFIEHFPELCLHVICLVSNTQTKCTEIMFICLTSTALNHLKLRNISVEGRQTKKTQKTMQWIFSDMEHRSNKQQHFDKGKNPT